MLDYFQKTYNLMDHWSFIYISPMSSTPLRPTVYAICLEKAMSDYVGKKFHHSDDYCSSQANVVDDC